MCDIKDGFKLCSCENESIKFREQEFYRKVDGKLVRIKNKKNDSIPLIYIWRLFTYVGEYEGSKMLGKYILPSDNIENGLDAEWIVLNLNIKNHFDFDYKPKEGDNLKIQQNVVMGSYMSFIFSNGQWTIDHYNPFTHEIKHLKEGILRALK